MLSQCREALNVLLGPPGNNSTLKRDLDNASGFPTSWPYYDCYISSGVRPSEQELAGGEEDVVVRYGGLLAAHRGACFLELGL